MKSIVTCLFLAVTLLGYAQDKTNKIKGIVSGFGSPIANVNIAIKGTTDGIQSDADGRYEIAARPRDVLVFSYVGMHSVEIIVEDVTSTLNISMVPRVEELDEVVVEQKKKDGQEGLQIDYATNKNIIRTSFGFVNAESTGYSMTTVDGATLNPGAIDIISAIRGKIPGLTVETVNSAGGGEEPAVFLRGRSSAQNPKPAIFEVDGQVFNTVPTFLSIDNIDRVAAISGLGATAKYGNLASGGVIIINTKGGFVMREEGTNKPYDQAKLRNNKYNPSDVVSKLKRADPSYLIKLKAAKTANDASQVYEEQKKLYGSSPYFFLDAANFFIKERQNQAMSSKILGEMKEKYGDNANALKALAYTFEELGDKKAALEVYKEVFKLRPRYAQSYRDMANMYAENGAYKKALGLHARYQMIRKQDSLNPPSEGIDGIMETESTNLIGRRGKELSIAPDNNTAADVGGTRVLFEWNNTEAEFDLQFVNPENRYSVWSHSLENEPERIREEKVLGYTSQQFLIDESSLGVWLINIKYLGNKAFQPTYLKTTVYHNYGRPSQSKKVEVFSLSEKNVYRELLSVVSNIGSR